MKLPPLVVTRDEKGSPLMKFEIILPLLCFLLDHLTNKHCKTWSYMINLWIDFRKYQNYKMLLSAGQRPTINLEPSKTIFLGEYAAVILTMLYILRDMVSQNS